MSGLLRRHLKILGACCAALWLASCSSKGAEGAAPAAAAAHEAPAKDSGPEPLSAEQIALAGIEVRPLEAAPVRDVVTGQAVVIGHDLIAQGIAEIRTTEATAAQSAAALKRIEDLSGTKGALGEDALEIARRQATVDRLQHGLALRRFDAQYGAGSHRMDATQWNALAEGRIKLIRIVMPEGTGAPASAARLRFVPLYGRAAHDSWHAMAVWPAPAEGGIPGVSLLAAAQAPDLAEGSRVLAQVEIDTAATGVLIPAAAVVMHGGTLWCYIQGRGGQYARRPVAEDHASEAGYVQTGGFKAGESVVVRGAGILLAREFGTVEQEP